MRLEEVATPKVEVPGVDGVVEAGGKVCDFKGATLARMDNRGPDTQQVVAGNLKVSAALQSVLVNSGYAAEFDAGKF